MAVPTQASERAPERRTEVLTELPPPPAPRSAVQMIRSLLVGMRPHQWAKNGFLFAPLVFSQQLFEPGPLLTAIAAFLLFSATASAVYLANDVRDVEADRRHPVKRHRPIASGALPVRLAIAASAVLALGALGLSLLVGRGFALVVLGYLAMNTAYSFGLKKIAWVDVGVIATGFVLRVLAGALAIAVPVSHWLLVCTFALALFLGLGKRKHEILVAEEAGHDGSRARKALKGYQLRHVNVALLVAGTLAAVSYVLYTMAPDTHEKFGTWMISLTVPFPAFGIWRFNRLVARHTRASSPTEALLTDPPFVANMVAWMAAVVAILYFTHVA